MNIKTISITGSVACFISILLTSCHVPGTAIAEMSRQTHIKKGVPMPYGDVKPPAWTLTLREIDSTGQRARLELSNVVERTSTSGWVKLGENARFDPGFGVAGLGLVEIGDGEVTIVQRWAEYR